MLQKTGAFDRWKRVSPPAQSSPMPFSEFHPAGRTTKLEPPHSKAPNFSPPDLPSTMTDSDFVELLWEKGQIVMQGQSSRPPKKSPHSSTFPAYSSRTMNDKGETNSDNIDVMNPRIGRPGPAIDPPGRDFAPVVIPNPVALSAQEDDVSPFLNYPIDDYYSELLSEFSGVNPNPFPGYCSNLTTPLVVKGATTTNGNPLGPGSEVVRDPYNMERLPSTGRARPGRSANQFVQQWQNSAQNNKSKPLEFGGAGSGVVFSLQSMSSDLPKAPPRQDVVTSPKPPVQPPTPSLNTGVINFSHFSRAAFLKDNLQNANRMLNNNSNDKVSVVTNSMDSTLIDSPTCLRSTMQENFSSTSCKPELTPPASQPSWKFALGTGRSEPVKWRDGIGNDNADGSGNASDGIRLPESMQVQMMGSVSTAMPSPVLVEKVPESVMAPSSVCSGNGIAAESGEPLHRAKRKATEEESSYQSEDIEDESIGAKKQPPTRVTTSKRSRAAEVHNLSERRRRDRINEKMRALQELIPNCNKVDKASMLDEAIEYLKTLQLQVQIMSMGGGFCMPPMMLPPAMHRIHPPHMAHFPPVGVGVGYGMGMLDMNGNPMYPLPPVPNPQFPCPSMGAAASSLHSMPPATTTGLPMFGIPSPGIPVTMHRPPSFIPHIAHLAWPNGSPDATTSAAGPTRISVVDPAGSKDLQEQNICSETSPRQGDPQAMTSTQPMKESIKHCSPSATNDQVSNSGDPANSSSGNGNSSSGASEQHDYY